MKYYLFLCTVLLLLSCTIENTNDQDIAEMVTDLREHCGKSDLVAVMENNTLSEECRTAVLKYLPETETNFQDKMALLGIEDLRDSGVTLNLAFSESIVDIELFSVKVITDDDTVAVSADDLTMGDLTFSEDKKIGISIVQDYSGSMRDEDLAVTIDIFEKVFGVFDDFVNAEVIAFSDSVVVQQEFTTEKGLVVSSLALDTIIDRNSTALYDAIGMGAQNLAEQDNLMRVMFLSTDGAENASQFFSRDSAIQTARSNGIPIIIFGSLFANLNFMKEVSRETYGYYIYAQTLSEMMTEADKAFAHLKNSKWVRIPRQYIEENATFLVEYEEKMLEITP